MQIMLNFTEYMNVSLTFRKQLISFCSNKLQNTAEQTRSAISLLDAFDNKAEKSEDFRQKVFGWFDKGGTLKLREYAKEVGFDYWKDIETSNIIDTFDSFVSWFEN